MEDEMKDGGAAETSPGRLDAAVATLERLVAQQAALGSVGPIVATVDEGREMELERKLADAEATIAALRAAAAAPATGGRKTQVASLLAKHGLDGEHVSAGALDAALGSLSIEQRIAVKAELLRAGMLAG